MAGWDVSQLIRNMGWLAKLGAAELGGSGLVVPRLGFGVLGWL